MNVIRNVVPEYLEETNRLVSNFDVATKVIGVQESFEHIKEKWDSFYISYLEEAKVVERFPLYKEKILSDFKILVKSLPYKEEINASVYAGHSDVQMNQVRNTVKAKIGSNEALIDNLIFNASFYKNLSYFDNHTVIVGANGSGKSSFASYIKTTLRTAGIVISAQRFLKIDTFKVLQSTKHTSDLLKRTQSQHRTYKEPNSYTNGASEFNVLLSNLIADQGRHNSEFLRKNLENIRIGVPTEMEESLLQKVFRIWNTVIKHREIDLDEDNINICVFTEGRKSRYHPISMSEGEKVVLYLAAQIVQAPRDSLIIVDEPEIHLHKTIVNQLWRLLEKERPDCIFIYLTHDLDFAVSMEDAPKLWMKSFSNPNKWDFEVVTSNDIPEELLLRLLGTQKKVVFCEGDSESNDFKTYRALFPLLEVLPVGSCTNVINYTKAFQNTGLLNSEVFGIIDADFRSSEEKEKLKQSKIYTLNCSEIESLFLSEEFLKYMDTRLLHNSLSLDDFKSRIFKKFEDEIETQSLKYIYRKLEFNLGRISLGKARKLNDLLERFNEVQSGIEIEKWNSSRIDELRSILTNKEYDSVLGVYNNKGLIAIANQEFAVTNFVSKCINALKDCENARTLIKKGLGEGFIGEVYV
ncbi:DUF4435 domain-containing protein [Halobacteriovorax vibrionivorans]|uniref:DUF4435 domain-containing protein n=1 Tax=Halobacteriovorax vibrionivorans TaxID=2152716 RepID=A0ABY0IJK1_9BACT|nr:MULTISPECIES: DUF4435 domain-containing protein [Halobacteriovorax]RZF21729.1 DUF4435 domain-containing protein [Halobacteriovorax vibrionivorans]TGD45650.1 DUF4435 domain-containing protein [Halobacteriovorax sp. Y22]